MYWLFPYRLIIHIHLYIFFYQRVCKLLSRIKTRWDGLSTLTKERIQQFWISWLINELGILKAKWESPAILSLVLHTQKVVSYTFVSVLLGIAQPIVFLIFVNTPMKYQYWCLVIVSYVVFIIALLFLYWHFLKCTQSTNKILQRNSFQKDYNDLTYSATSLFNLFHKYDDLI